MILPNMKPKSNDPKTSATDLTFFNDFQGIFENLNVPILVADENLDIIVVNLQYEILVGYSRQELIGKNILDIIKLPENKQLLTKYHAQRMLDPCSVPSKYEIVIIDKNDNVQYLLLNVSLIPESKYTLASMQNITEQRQAEAKVKASENYYQTIFDTTGTATLLLEEDMSISRVNRECERIIGYTNEELTSMKWPQIIHPDFVEQMKQFHQLRRALPNAAPFKYKTRMINKQNQPREGLMAVELIPGTKTSVATFIDLTDFNRIDRSLKAISACNQIMLHAQTEKELLHDICQTIVDIGDYSMCWVGYLQEDAKQTVLPVAWAGKAENYVENLKISLTDKRRRAGPTGMSIITGKPVIVRDIKNEKDRPWLKSALQQGFKSSMSIPLLNQNKPFGALCIYADETGIFNGEEQNLLKEMADNLDYAIITLRTRQSHSQTLRKTQLYVEKMRVLMRQAANALGAVIEKRDPYTAGHQSNVAAMAVAIAREMGLSDEQLAGLYAAASLHDIGKITVPIEILSKPGILSEPELAIVKSHSQVGYEILKEIEFPWPVADIVLQHHEKIDGSGYPNGLRGQEIMLEARIITVADVVEAMSAHRPYRPTRGLEEAIKEITDNRGILYDPEVVDICLQLIDRDFADH
ncbi:MAG TPA: PAS domain S-box protein [Syntrophomonas sp.]|nr:PAS domain S-box protein [Syntrophomonas sp.]HRW11511.1 PAS domain S-box protein [Syntrophomonas sp.]